jgi:biopolymer transport protein ExbB
MGEVADQTTVEMVAQWFKSGGGFMWAILFILATACAVALERFFYYLFINRGDPNKMVAELARRLNADDIEGAKQAVSARRAPTYVLLRTALERYESGMKADDIQEGVDETAIDEVPKMSSRLNYLSLFANVSTLLGLLGTIAGLQTSFASLATVEAAQKSVMLSQGIAMAMNTTAFGLMVAIPCMVLYTVLSNQRDRIVQDLDEAVVRMMNYLRKKTA